MKRTITVVKIRTTTFLTMLFIVFLLNGQSNQRMVYGHVSDATTEESLPGVSVVIKGTQLGTITDIDGNFSLLVLGVSEILEFRYLGYEEKQIEIGESDSYNVSLQYDVKSLAEVKITAQARGQKGAIQRQINANTIKNVVAADRLQENPDANAVEAIGRLPGISVIRGGGEGNGIVVRGLSPAYSKVTLNGIEMPSTGDDRSTNISGISQYMLQGVEVYKSLTADMEGDAVAGTVNLTLRETPKGLRSKVMAQMGYNNMNSYWGNYKVAGDISNRFFNNKLGVSLSLNAERVMRSTQTMSAGYSSGNSADDIDILINSIGLNLIENIKYRRSAMMSIDFKLHPRTTLNLYSLYTYSNSDYSKQTKNYGTVNTGDISYGVEYNPFAKNHIWQNAVSGRTALNFMEANYGIAYSYNRNDNPKSRSWGMDYSKLPQNNLQFTEEIRREDPAKLIPFFEDDVLDNIQLLQLTRLGTSNSLTEDMNLTSYLDLKFPFKIGVSVTGHVKVGGRYRQKNRIKDVTSGGQALITNQFAGDEISKRVDWLELNATSNILSVGIPEGYVGSFLNGAYDFGSTFSIDRLNEVSDAWEETAQYWSDYADANGGWGAKLPDGSSLPNETKSDYTYNLANSVMNDQHIVENYYATYLLTELRLGKWAMIMPGLRYEKTEAAMAGFRAIKPQYTPPLRQDISGVDTSTTRGDEFFLPMVHLRITPHKNFYLHGAYTQTLRRPSFNDISPNTYIEVKNSPPHTYITKAPQLEAEQWTSYDLQFTYHSPKAGLLSVTGFYKEVDNKMWTRSWTRLPGEPLVGIFGDLDQVEITRPENHINTIFLKGFETEVQTSFWYLPKPFNYFTTSINYTYTHSNTEYPISWLEQEYVIPPGGGRPTVNTFRIDTALTDRMTNSPKHIVNASIGFNKGGLNVWLSYQYNGDILTSKILNESAVTQNGEMDGIKQSFERWDLQVSYKFKSKLEGLEIIGNFANLSDFMETRNLRGDIRTT